MLVRLPLWPPSWAGADGLKVQSTTDPDDTWTDVGTFRDIGTYPHHETNVLVDHAKTGTMLPWFRYAWTSGTDHQGEWSEPWRPGDLGPLWLYPVDIRDTASTSRYTSQYSTVELAQLITQARERIIEGLGTTGEGDIFDTDRAGFPEAIRLGMRRMIEWLLETEDPGAVTTATGLQQEKIGSYSYWRAETAAEAYGEALGSLPHHVEALLRPYLVSGAYTPPVLSWSPPTRSPPRSIRTKAGREISHQRHLLRWTGCEWWTRTGHPPNAWIVRYLWPCTGTRCHRRWTARAPRSGARRSCSWTAR